MMKPSKKLLGLMLAITMVLGLTACGKTGSSSSWGEEQKNLNIGI